MTLKTKQFIIRIPGSIAFYMFARKMRALPHFFKDFILFKKKDVSKRFSTKIIDFIPCLTDRTKTTSFEPHYTFHPPWAARIIVENNPSKHIDISSIIHFSTMLSAYIPVDFYDYRPVNLFLPNLECKKGDLLALPFADNSIESISCMHTIEHIGLGRYGDTIDPEGDIKAINELKRVVRPGGTLIFVTPVGKPRIAFNAHRVYSYEQVIGMFVGMKLQEFSLVPDDYKKYGLMKGASKEIVKDQLYACGCFWFIKK